MPIPNEILEIILDYLYTDKAARITGEYSFFLYVVGAHLCRLSPIDAHPVALKPIMGK